MKEEGHGCSASHSIAPGISHYSSQAGDLKTSNVGFFIVAVCCCCVVVVVSVCCCCVSVLLLLLCVVVVCVVVVCVCVVVVVVCVLLLLLCVVVCVLLLFVCVCVLLSLLCVCCCCCYVCERGCFAVGVHVAHCRLYNILRDYHSIQKKKICFFFCNSVILRNTKPASWMETAGCSTSVPFRTAKDQWRLASLVCICSSTSAAAYSSLISVI